MMKKLIAICCLAMLLAGCCGCARQQGVTDAGSAISLSDISENLRSRGGYSLRAAVLYSSAALDAKQDILLDYLKQALVLGLSAVAIDAARSFDLQGTDILFVDESVAGCGEQVFSEIAAFAEAGGFVCLPSSLCDRFSPAFLGIESAEALNGFPETLVLPEVPGDLEPLQTLIADFHSIYPHYADAEALLAMDYGRAMRVTTAIPLACCGDAALYALSRCGDGAVLLTSPLLPNFYSKGAFSLAVFDGQTSFANSTASCNQLFLSEFAAYAAKQLYGFSMHRVFGAYGSPAMSWELHYEDITSIAHDSLGQFEPICRENKQIPSISLIRNPYTWFEQAETMAYALNQSGDGALSFQLDRDESAYSSGTHIAVGSEWLQLNALQDCISYFDDAEWENYRLFPCVLDYDGDGLLDAFCGSSDGKVYFFRGLGFTGLDGRLCMEEPVPVRGVSVPSFSAPALTDFSGDGVPDLLVGASDGCIYGFLGDGSLRFAAQGVLLDAETAGQCLPCVGDLNADGVDDLAVGSASGILDIYYGVRQGDATAYSHRRMADLSRQCAERSLGKWLSPHISDFNGDGAPDLALGTYDGYVALFPGDGDGGFRFDGFVTVADMNFKGNANLKFGHYCTPVFCDLNGDGAQDLLCGYEEYGMAYPIDSAYFPYRAELQAQIDAALANHEYIGVHFLTGYRYSADREAYELSRQFEAFQSYGLSEAKGANQHTWRMSVFDEAQSLMSVWNAGLLWESGYAPSRSTTIAPQTAAENVIALPFYLMRDGERTLLVQNCSVLAYMDESWTDLSGKYGMPVLVYYHCDMIYKSDEGAKAAAAKVAQFQDKFAYNFVKEDQLMYGVAAACNLAVDVRPEANGFSIEPLAEDTGFALYDENAQRAAGVRLEFTDRLAEEVAADAAVWTRAAGGLAVGLDRTVSVFAAEGPDAPHILRVNTPADITASDQGAVIAFQSDGMQQAAVLGAATTPDEGWTAEARDGVTVFTAYAEAPVLHIAYQEMD